MWQRGLAIISQPHQITVDEDGEIVAVLMGVVSVADQNCRHKLGRGPSETIQGSGHGEGAVGIEGLTVFCHDAIDAGVSGDVANQHFLVAHQILPQALVGPVVDQLLKGYVCRPVIWVGHKDGLLRMISEVPTLFGFCKSVVKSPGLGEIASSKSDWHLPEHLNHAAPTAH